MLSKRGFVAFVVVATVVMLVCIDSNFAHMAGEWLRQRLNSRIN